MTVANTLRTWVAPRALPQRTRLRLICLPYAATGASMFRNWSARLAPLGIDVCAVKLPGREARLREPLIDELSQLVPQLRVALAPLFDLPFVLLGTSMGALIAFELARELRRSGLRGPIQLFACACRAPSVPDPKPYVHAASSDELIALLRRYGGTPDELLADPQLLEPFLQVIRADAALTELYCHVPEDPLTCPIAIYGATDDAVTPPHELREWARHTDGPTCERWFHGGHFFVRQHEDEVLRLLAEDLVAAPGGGI